jgi:hypothetical protein
MNRRASSLTSTPVGEAPPQVVEHYVDDAFDLGLGQRLEQHDVVDAVEEIRPEMPAQQAEHGIPDVGLDLAGGHALQKEPRPDVRGHDDDSITEVDSAPPARR